MSSAGWTNSLQYTSGLGRRGPDSVGVAIYGHTLDGDLALRIKLGEGDQPSALLEPDYFEQKGWQIAERVQHLGVVGEATTTAECLRLALDYSGDPRQLERLIEAEDKAVEVVSMGHNLEIIKQVGSPENLNATFDFSRLAGSHGIGHHPPLHDAVPRTCG